MEDNIVIVLDTSNYVSKYCEEVPFKAKVKEKFDNEIWVISLVTNREYELYYSQILEFLPIEDINKLINLNEYGR